MGIESYGVNVLDEKGLSTVEKIINDSSKLKWHDAIIKGEDNKLVVKQKVRNCKTCFLDYNQELENLFVTIVEDFNRNHSGWNYDLTNIEAIQLTHYFKGDFYDWHVDTLAKPIIRNGVGHNRKVSVTIFLNDPEEYEGGEFDLEVRGPKQNRKGASKGFGTKNSKEKERFDVVKLPKGSIIIFPSSFWHRVRPVISGVRKSLVIWFQGPSFR
tara:strand:- start:270 stop:908 length:639 start_codon:yes stop_codon:yes gene_type:complete